MKKMRKSASNVNNAVNLISGAYTLPLIDKLFSNSQRIENMDDVYFAITALVDTDRISEAFHIVADCFLQALFPQKCRLTSSKLHGEFPQYCISPSGTLLGAGEEPLQAYKVY